MSGIHNKGLKCWVLLSALNSLADNSQWNQICPHQCTEITFKMSSKRTPHDISDLALVYMSYYSDRMLLLEEYLVFDFSSILVAIGGSLGLFLGFSFFQCGSEILYESMGYLGKLVEFCKKKCDKESNETEMAWEWEKQFIFVSICLVLEQLVKVHSEIKGIVY